MASALEPSGSRVAPEIPHIGRDTRQPLFGGRVPCDTQPIGLRGENEGAVSPAGTLTSAQQRAIRSLRLDRVAVEAVDAMQREGIDVLLLKGPAFARWLYDDPAVRGYRDVDLLVRE